MTLNASTMKQALQKLDSKLRQPVTLIIGGGGAMLLAHQFPLATADIDAIPKGIETADLDLIVKEIAQELGLPPDWLNPYYSTFSHCLPGDYGLRLIPILEGKFLKAHALGKEDMLIMKCFAHRQKDIGHAKALIKQGANIQNVESHIESLQSKGISGAKEALDFLDDLSDGVS